ncbi:amidase family protein [Levilactobacillus suantsaiihabitans]|uniref:Cell wall anchor protein n=1 Tax=Levilactobacillus suantsaiihabitans TaxID=2487722 RepID=A0A4Z0JCI6_9LACO|nr:amidase family protein [Levilactobacillus suantsaiihabitans]TGD20466.1 cell wall anchor protein [Levilactobacillus suantsaiihabitans]
MVKNTSRHGQRWLTLALVLILSLGTLLPVTASAADSTVTANAPTAVAQPAGISEHAYETQSALQLAQAVRSGQTTSTQLVKQAIAKVKADNPRLNSVITLREDAALKEAADLQDTGQKFLGVPILIKGLGHTIAGMPNTNGLLASRDNVTKSTSRIVKNLQAQGFIVIGQTNFPEMGLLNITNSKLYGPASNPWNLADNPGGSSGGSTASVADGMTPVASGSDAGGSVRIPASWSGVIGLKPTQGAISSDSSADTATTVNFVETKTMADTAALFAGLKNATFKLNAVPAQLKDTPIAYSTKSPVGTPVSQDAVDAVHQAVNFLKAQGFTVKEVNAPTDGVALMKAYYLLDTSAGSVANYISAPKLGHAITTNDVSTLDWALYQASKRVTADQTAAARDTIAQAKDQMARFHEQYPLYLTPTTATTAPANSDPSVLPAYEAKLAKIDQLATSEDQLQLIYDAWLHGLSKSPFTQQANLTGEPAISLPTYVSPRNGMPLGIQFNAAKGGDDLLLKMGDLFESHHLFKLLQDRQAPTTATTPTTPATPEAPKTPATKPATSTPKPAKPRQTKPTVRPVTKATPRKVLVTKKVIVYRHLTGTKVAKTYAKHQRSTAHVFNVLGTVRAHGHLWYRVSGGYIKAAAVTPLYYQHPTSKVKTLQGIYAYSGKTLKHAQRQRYIKPGRVLKIKRLVKTGHVTRYQLRNGDYITANKQFIVWK